MVLVDEGSEWGRRCKEGDGVPVRDEEKQGSEKMTWLFLLLANSAFFNAVGFRG